MNSMIIGRIVFGLGGEAINATQSTLIVNWFSPKELSFALGIALSILRFSSVLNDIISPIIATVINK
jgi:MFS family permease